MKLFRWPSDYLANYGKGHVIAMAQDADAASNGGRAAPRRITRSDLEAAGDRN